MISVRESASGTSPGFPRTAAPPSRPPEPGAPPLRLGGEEFLIVLPAAGHEEGLLVAERLRKTIEESRPGGLPVTCSFGVSAGAGDQVLYSRLFKAADEALYRAKAGGRNRVCGDEAIAASMPELAPQPVPVA